MYRAKMGSEIRSTYLVLFSQTTKLLFSLLFLFFLLLLSSSSNLCTSATIPLHPLSLVRCHKILSRDNTNCYSRICSFVKFCSILYEIVGRDSSVDIATRYGMGGPGIKSRWERALPHQSTPTLGLTQWVSGLFPGGKAAGAWC